MTTFRSVMERNRISITPSVSFICPTRLRVELFLRFSLCNEPFHYKSHDDLYRRRRFFTFGSDDGYRQHSRASSAPDEGLY